MTSAARNPAFAEPARLLPVRIAKPWGEEVWFSAVEARGESSVVIDGEEKALSGVLRSAGETPDRLPLLKILAPSSRRQLGDLYFEAHEHKRELYIVTGIALDAWPEGVGEMRYGLSQAKRADFGSDDDFREAYLAATEAYEAIRRRIDGGERGLKTAEAAARKAMEHFHHTRQLELGDVVTVDAWLPHGLRNGVRVVEFQTPSYDRYILSFGQAAWTQDHWDTRDALPRLRLDVPDDPQPSGDVSILANFSDLSIQRFSGNADRLPAAPGLVVVMAIGGSVRLGRLTLQHEEAALVPAGVDVSLDIDSEAQLVAATRP